MKTTKLTHHIILSGITVSLLFSPLMALPSGGKFTHGTTGTININGNTMNINGHKVSSVIQWGGGFSINQGESVNFGGSNKNYLNIAHGTSKSTIAGLLNANGNNVFLINPNGVIITKTGTINANRFVASTSSMDNTTMQNFANMNNFNDGLSFSPVFKPNKLGNVVNMGNINANKVLLIGNKVLLQSSFNTKNKTFNQIKASNIHLVGNEIHADIATLKDINKLYITAKDKGSLYLNATGYYYNPSSFSHFNNYESKAYNGINHNNTNFSNMRYVGIGSDVDWWHFAKGWNENKAGFRTSASEYKLTNDIDFKGNKGQGVEGRDWQNYANYCLSTYNCTSMIVGFSNAFNKTFDGQGYTLKNINIDITSLSNKPEYVGIFGSIYGATFKNINVDYMGGGIKANDVGDYFRVGGFVGWAYGGTHSNISLNNIGNISTSGGGYGRIYVGGFAGYVERETFSNISLNNIGDISSSGISSSSASAGGFAGGAIRGTFSNISLNNIGNISSSGSSASAGGFAGSAGGTYSNISLNNIGNISASGGYNDSQAGGFAGVVLGTFSNISLNNIGNISSSGGSRYTRSQAGGFAGNAGYGTFSNISLNNIGNISASVDNNFVSAAGFAGIITVNSTFKNIYIFFNPNMSISASGNWQNYIGKFFGYINGSPNLTFDNVHIYHHTNDLANATYDQNYWGSSNDKIQIHTYNNSNQENVYQDFLSKANTISRPTPPTNPSNPDVILGSDDVISANDLNTWLGEILAGNYWIDINDLSSIKGISEELKQSISFLEALYGQEGMKEILEGFSNDYKINYRNYQRFATNKANLLAFINDKLKPLVKQSNKAFIDLKTAQEQLKTAIAKYNDYVKKVNENPSLKNDATLNSLKAEVDRLNNLSKELFASINDNQELLQTWQSKTSTDSNNHFKIKGEFKNLALLTPNLDEVIVNGNENEDYKKVSRQVANAQKQTPTFEYEENEKEEVEETALMQKGKICIVSDNFKTMNPCVTGSF
ncbi:two-partner secretion domain-containing protein [Campylobacter sp. RM16704]|uniref:two-partner secretion domain-containing protein n=1 Tax=Campylobacter sp. RM16704 TaxID=1500960 RepID=UPI00057C72A6|nr:filamentous hemagglutinin N-terminal domain-containing protein [Campylobacter sp. RM16704]AJC86969.1 hemagglutinin domain-containing protein [Campylobacter sp. RM16704]